jgi:hypothetical protein
VEVRLRGRVAPAGRRARLLLPGEAGLPAAVEDGVDVAPGGVAGAAADLRDREAG